MKIDKDIAIAANIDDIGIDRCLTFPIQTRLLCTRDTPDQPTACAHSQPCLEQIPRSGETAEVPVDIWKPR